MKKLFICKIMMVSLLLTACQPNSGDPSNAYMSEADATYDYDHRIRSGVIDVIQNHISAVELRDKQLLESTTLHNSDYVERVYALWNNNTNVYKLKTLTYGHGDENNEVVTVTFENDEILSFALTKTEEGWKIYDID